MGVRPRSMYVRIVMLKVPVVTITCTLTLVAVYMYVYVCVKKFTFVKCLTECIYYETRCGARHFLT